LARRPRAQKLQLGQDKKAKDVVEAMNKGQRLHRDIHWRSVCARRFADPLRGGGLPIASRQGRGDMRIKMGEYLVHGILQLNANGANVRYWHFCDMVRDAHEDRF
jgi:hypothetical protein